MNRKLVDVIGLENKENTDSKISPYKNGYNQAKSIITQAHSWIVRKE
jgi:hypothetical protein